MAKLLPLLLSTALIFVQSINALPNDQVVFNSNSANHKGVLKVRQELMKAEIIPTVISDFIPSLTLTVSWPNKTAKLGNTVEPGELQDAPIIKLHGIPSSSTLRSSGLTYTIALTDPDAPSRDNPEWSEMCHWIATNVPVSSDSTEEESNSKKLKEIMPWKPPGPPPKTGKHRYVFLAFAPANGTTKKLKLSKPSNRQHWGTGKERHGVRDWAEENGMAPVAANFIYSQNEKQ